MIAARCVAQVYLIHTATWESDFFFFWERKRVARGVGLFRGTSRMGEAEQKNYVERVMTDEAVRWRYILRMMIGGQSFGGSVEKGLNTRYLVKKRICAHSFTFVDISHFLVCVGKFVYFFTVYVFGCDGGGN